MKWLAVPALMLVWSVFSTDAEALQPQKIVTRGVKDSVKALGAAMAQVTDAAGVGEFAPVEPKLKSIEPRGGQRGTDITIRFRGDRLDRPRALLVEGTGITCDAPVKDDEKGFITCVVHLAADAEPGLRLCRLVTDGGISNPVLFAIGALPEVNEKENNSAPERAQRLELPVTVNGVVKNEDVDLFAFDLEAGATVAFEVIAMRFGDATFDPSLTIYDDQGRPIASADDTPPFGADAALVFTAEKAGRYLLELRETSYRGGRSFIYRLAAGAFPRPIGVVPCAGNPGSEVDLQWFGDPTLTTQKVTLPSEARIRTDILAQRDGAIAPCGVPFRLTDLPITVETEPNNTMEQATPMVLNGAACGNISTAGDVDWFVFDVAKDTNIDLRLYAGRIGSALDAVLHVQRVVGDGAAGNDDAAGLDSAIRFKSTDDGKLAVAVRDLLHKGGDNFHYVLEVRPVAAAVSLRLNEPELAALSVPQGNRSVMIVTTERADFGGPLAVESFELPPGVAMHAPQMHPAVSQMPIVLEAAADADVNQPSFSRWTVRHADPNVKISGTLAHSFALIKYNNDQPLESWQVDRLAVAVTQPAPIVVEINTPPIPIVPLGSMTIPVHVERFGGHKGDVTVRLAWTPPGISAGTITLKEDQTDGVIPMDANGGPAVGKWPLVASAETVVGGGKLVVCSALMEIEIAPAMVTMEVQRTRTEIGVDVDLAVKVAAPTPFEGEATLTLLGLPPKVTTETRQIAKDATETTFHLAVDGGAPVGHHGGVFVLARIPTPGGEIIHRSPAGLLIIDKPLPPKDPAEEAARAEAKKKAEAEKQRKLDERRAAAERRRAEREARRRAATQPATR